MASAGWVPRRPEMGRAAGLLTPQFAHELGHARATSGRGKRGMVTGERYEIRVKGRLGSEWSAWFDGLTVTNRPRGETVLSGLVVDQAALHGILSKIRDLGLPLLSVRCGKQLQEEEEQEGRPADSTGFRTCGKGEK